MNSSFKVGQKLDLEISEVNFNHVIVGKEDKEAFLYNREMPKVTVEMLIVDDDDKHVVLLEEEIDGENKLVLPGATVLPDESSGETGMRILKEYVKVDMDSGDLELYDFRTSPERDHRQWLMSVIYIARLENKGEEFWADIKDVLLHEDAFGYDHHRVLQNFEYNC